MSEFTPKTSPINTAEVLQAIARSTEYAEQHVNKKGDSRSRMIANAALNIVDSSKTESGYIGKEALSINVVGHLAEFWDNKKTLDTMRANGSKSFERLPYLKKVVEFNHSVKVLIDNNPSLKFGEVLTFLRNSHASINGPGELPAFEQEMRQTLEGMRHEIAVEQMIGLMQGIEYRDAGVDEDMRGADIFISVDNSDFAPFDIKASSALTMRKKEESIRRKNNPDLIIWSHVSSDDFGDSFRLPQSTLYHRAPSLQSDILNAFYPQTDTQSLTL